MYYELIVWARRPGWSYKDYNEEKRTTYAQRAPENFELIVG